MELDLSYNLFSINELTPAEQEAAMAAEFTEWYDIYNGVDRYMETAL